MMRECEEIKRLLPISSRQRPAWDLMALGEEGFREFSIDLGISSRVYVEKDEFYNPLAGISNSGCLLILSILSCPETGYVVYASSARLPGLFIHFILLVFNTHRNSISQRNDRSCESLIVFQFEEVFPHPGMDRPVSPLYGKP